MPLFPLPGLVAVGQQIFSPWTVKKHWPPLAGKVNIGRFSMNGAQAKNVQASHPKKTPLISMNKNGSLN
jgi:hypothetical protein